MCFYMAGDTRIELVLTESKSVVLPLHKSPTLVRKFLKNNKHDGYKTKNPLTFQVEGFGK